MSYTFTRTREQLRDKIGRVLGIKEEGQSLSPEEAAVINEGLDLRLKELHSLGALWWNVAGATTNVTMTAGVSTVSLSSITDFLFPVTFKLRVGSEDRDVDIISHVEYQDIPEKSNTGEPVKAFFSGSTVYLWPTPDLAYVGKLTYQAISEDTATNTAVDVPVSCMRALSILVASDLCEDFDIPDSKTARIRSQVQDARDTILAVSQQKVDSKIVTPEWY